MRQLDITNRKILWLDTETTGLDCSVNFAHQISYILTDGPDKVLFERNLKMIPDDPEKFVIEDKALEVSGLKPEDILSYKKESEVFPVFLQDMRDATRDDRLVFCGYNCLFDIGFLSKMIDRSATREKASYDWGTFFDSSYDVLSEVRRLKFRENALPIENCRQPTVAAYFGIGGDFHDALVDIRTCREIYLRLRKEGMI
jgi:DNA polymerase III epsilon subunit-like protein